MPGLIALGRRWSVGSDDLVIPSTIFLVIHVVWTIILICVVSQPHEPKTCSSQLFLSIVGYLVLQLLTTVAEVMVTVISLRGTILYVRPRQHMKYVLYVTGVSLLNTASMGSREREGVVQLFSKILAKSLERKSESEEDGGCILLERNP
ncbi:diacylglycerol lipase-alpha-like [Diadema setosum]|uniref:diacylglycerol lipase-alpha-like n=1 Tax=Diadema setosum TaxID=31175 RepID=UPI003B3AE1ED